MNIDFIFVVGGGSVIDGVKYVVVSVKYEGEGWDIFIGVYIVDDVLFIGVILILLVMGFEFNGGLVISKKVMK